MASTLFDLPEQPVKAVAARLKTNSREVQRLLMECLIMFSFL
jgi:hypothetical protein